jgi:hypothetical protein
LDGNWDTSLQPTAADDVVFDPTVDGTITLSADAVANSLTVTGDYVFNSPVDATVLSQLTVISGNMTLDSNDGRYSRYPDFRGVVLQIGDGETAVTDAVWTLTNTHANKRSHQFGEIKGIQDTVVTLAGDYNARFSVTSSNFFGNIVNSTQRQILLDADNAMGVGTFTADAVTSLNFARKDDDYNDPGVSHKYDMDIVTNATVYLNTPLGTTATLNGDLSGAGQLRAGKKQGASTAYAGLYVLNGDSTRTGTFVTEAAQIVEINGTWTNSGTISHMKGTISGVGSIGLASGARLDVSGTAYGNSAAEINPGKPGEIGTLTVGTTGNNNEVRFQVHPTAGVSSLIIDVAGTQSDRLAVNGKLNLGYVGNALYINGELEAATEYTLATYDSLAGTTTVVDEEEIFTPYMFTNVYYNGNLIADPLAEDAFGGTHNLVYGDNSIQLLLGIPVVQDFIAGDCDGSYSVDSIDLMTLLDNWDPAGTTRTWAEGNFDEAVNGNIDSVDLMALLDNWSPGGYGVAVPTAAVPEPATLALLSIGGLALIRRKTRS